MKFVIVLNGLSISSIFTFVSPPEFKASAFVRLVVSRLFACKTAIAVFLPCGFAASYCRRRTRRAACVNSEFYKILSNFSSVSCYFYTNVKFGYGLYSSNFTAYAICALFAHEFAMFERAKDKSFYILFLFCGLKIRYRKYYGTG